MAATSSESEGPVIFVPSGAGVFAGISRRDADGVVEVRGMRVVGEAVVLFFRIMQQHAELHALAGEFAVRTASPCR